MPGIPVTNPLTVEKVQLGRYLFYDKRMSLNGTFSCGSCHKQELAFTDGLDHAKGATGQIHPRSAMTLVNVAWNTAFNWGDTTVHSLEEQVLKPMMGTQPVELGYSAGRAREAVFPSHSVGRHVPARCLCGRSQAKLWPWTTTNIAKAIASRGANDRIRQFILGSVPLPWRGGRDLRVCKARRAMYSLRRARRSAFAVTPDLIFLTRQYQRDQWCFTIRGFITWRGGFLIRRVAAVCMKALFRPQDVRYVPRP